MTRYTYLTQYKKTGINSTSCHELSLHTQQKIRRNKFNPCSAMTKYQYIYVLQTNFKPNKNVVKPERVVRKRTRKQPSFIASRPFKI